MLVVDPSSTCDICLEPFQWDTTLKIPHIIDCGHVFCAECLHQVFPTKCPLCRKPFFSSDIRKLHVEPCPDDEKEEMELLKQLISAYDSSEEEILRLRIRVDTWLAARTLDEQQSPLRRARDALDQYQQLKQRRSQDRRKIKTMERAARQWEKTVQENATRREAEAAITEQALRSQLAENQVQIGQLRAEIDKKQAQLDRNKIKKIAASKPLPLPKVPTPISNPLPAPPRLVHVTTNKSDWTVDRRARGNIHPSRLPVLERDDGIESLEDNAAYFTCRTAPYVWLEEDDFAEEPLLRRPVGNTINC